MPLFVVISGNRVTASTDAARRHPQPGALFFRRRFRRIYPPYWVWLAIAAFAIWLVERSHPGFFESAFVPDPRGLSLWQWIGNSTLTKTWRWHVTGGMENVLLSHSWTLCYEEQFYALVGLALLVARRFFFATLALVTAAVLAGPEQLLVRRVSEPNQSYFCAFAFALVLIPLHKWDARLAKAKLLRPFESCGEMCYSLYLIHWPVVTIISWGFNQLALKNPFLILFSAVPACVLVAVALARLFHVLVERRFWNPAYAKQK